MEAALSALRQGNIGIRVLQDTKLTWGIHTRYSSSYKVWAVEAEKRHRGGITIVWREELVWQVEGAKNFGPNVVSFTIMSRRRQWYVFGHMCPPTANWWYIG